MNHPPDEQLADYVDGAVDLSDRAAIESHLAFCQTCRSDVEAARAAQTALVGMPSVPAPPTDLGFLPGLSPRGGEGRMARSGGGWGMEPLG